MPSAPDCVRPSQTRTKAQALPHVPSEGPRLQQCRVQRTANGMPVLSPRGSSQGALPRLHQVYTDREQQKNDRPSRAPATKSHGGNPASRPETGRCHPRKRGTKKEKGSGPRGSGPGAGRQFNAGASPLYRRQRRHQAWPRLQLRSTEDILQWRMKRSNLDDDSSRHVIRAA